MSDATQPILKAEHLGITFGGLKAVSNFNMTINKGELIGLIGPNGAGKTTVFNLLTGVYKPTEGEFWLDGTRMNGKKTYQVVRAGIARTFFFRTVASAAAASASCKRKCHDRCQ